MTLSLFLFGNFEIIVIRAYVMMMMRMGMEFHVLDTGLELCVLDMWEGHELVWYVHLMTIILFANRYCYISYQFSITALNFLSVSFSQTSWLVLHEYRLWIFMSCQIILIQCSTASMKCHMWKTQVWKAIKCVEFNSNLH